MNFISSLISGNFPAVISHNTLLVSRCLALILASKWALSSDNCQSVASVGCGPRRHQNQLKVSIFKCSAVTRVWISTGIRRRHTILPNISVTFKSNCSAIYCDTIRSLYFQSPTGPLEYIRSLRLRASIIVTIQFILGISCDNKIWIEA